ncbi:MAG: shikimate kinase [Treponema sp.]|nr:shikimate kinase [Treponema sp.]MCL2250521.1 shikimate kinase [Treponema sp.]
MNKIILTGPKHSGKTSAGKALASLFSCDFIDLDDLITKKTGKTPRQLFIEGQSVFQKAEAEAASTLMTQNRFFIIAAGGGIIDNSEAIAAIKNSGTTMIYLNISANLAWSRIAAGGELPPFLQTENPQETHRALHERRAAGYVQIADIIIDVDGKSPEQIAQMVLKEYGLDTAKLVM